MIAHVAGVPVEELIPTVAGAGSMLLLARGWLSLRLQRDRSSLRDGALRAASRPRRCRRAPG